MHFYTQSFVAIPTTRLQHQRRLNVSCSLAGRGGSSDRGRDSSLRPMNRRTLHPALISLNRHIVDACVAAVDAAYPTSNGESVWRRLWLLEVVARVPYFTFLCVNHLAETLGLGSERITERLRAHFAEADNEALHLAVMEVLGGGDRWVDRFAARHAALAYFWIGVVAYLLSPALAYNFNEFVEMHAYDTYDKILQEQEFMLRYEASVPLVAREYYVNRAHDPRDVQSMFDVLQAIRDDEAGHAHDLHRYSEESLGDVPWRR